GWAGHAADAAGEPAEAVRFWVANHALVQGPATELPAYGALDDVLRQAAGAARAAAGAGSEQPLFLVGAPGSGVERVALLLRSQDQVPLLDERFVTALRADAFLRPEYPRWLSGDLGAAMDVLAAWRTGVSARYVDPAAPLVDWLPHFDARQLRSEEHPSELQSLHEALPILRSQDQVPLLDERVVTALRADAVLRPEYPRWLSGDLGAAMDVLAAWRTGVSARHVDPAAPLVDWLPHFDARQLAILPAALPCARFVLALLDS